MKIIIIIIIIIINIIIIIIIIIIHYGKPDIMRIVKSRRLRWAGHVTRMGMETAYRKTRGEASSR